MRFITPSYHRTDTGKLLEARPALGIGTEGGRVEAVGGLYLYAEGTSALVTVTANRNGSAAVRRFHIGRQRSAWLSVVGWKYVTVNVDQIGTVGTVGKAYAAWTTERPPQLASLVFVELYTVAGAISVPEGAVGVLPSVPDAAATQTVSLTPALVVATPLATGVKTEVVGNILTIAAVPQHLAWFLEGI